jgi:ATP-dependent protease ClpP protease subunit
MTQYIIFMAEVQIHTSARLRKAITDSYNNGATSIYLAISSGGGLISEGLSLAALLRSLPVEVITHNIGQTDSIANVIFSSGKKRYATPGASFLFHGVSQPLNGTMSEAQLHESYTNLVRMRESIAINFSAYTGIPVQEINNLMVDGGKILLSAEALSKNIIHEILDFNIPPGSQIISIGNEL